MTYITATVQTTYANLLQMHLNQPAFEFSGNPFIREIAGKKYWYANQRVGANAAPRQRYLGPDTKEMRARIEKMRSELRDQSSFRKSASALVSQLRASGAPTLDRQAGAILRAFCSSGVFRLGGTLIGTHAFNHYDLITGIELSKSMPAQEKITHTEDIDIASFEKLSVVVEDKAEPDLSQTLNKLNFKPKNTLEPNAPTSWVRADGAYAVDFLTPSFGGDRSAAKLEALNIWAKPLPFLNFLIRAPLPAVSLYMEGLLVQIPAPERYAVHKLIVSQRRHAGSAKKRKDIAQARSLIYALSQHTPGELYDALAEADQEGQSWRQALDHALTLRFAAPELYHDFARDVVTFSGAALNAAQSCAISAEALQDHFGVTDWNGEALLEAARRNRSRIEHAAQRKFRKQPSSELLLTSADMAEFAPN